MESLIGFYEFLGQALLFASFTLAVIVCGRIALDIFMTPDYTKKALEAEKEVEREKKK